ncbi:MAG: bifunctional diaminohydroxyphosphoribosylaminopyrimidine deaminase/5-amino-6-(5-phosphoribosylamino)uracil reductase RibD [Bacteroidales bacterium]|jgi:diaminohydroxyphosphoribosylaminopyrimidine deaminase/5-amino-6-(5-phosphoribosylamino)uracil reductase|nr:bifunctional diaminohydroxyphosphoribosylaminopyrimidine deaminase/5-amino-6-(5-phosphoribosylamino)uracil reductase RibD [Bacteroidales bacterium]
MTVDESYMARCLELASLGLGQVQPNPMVGAVLVADGKIIGEGWHRKYGEPHAEVNAFNSVEDKQLLSSATLYVNLEPCSHYGKTPPCADTVIAHNVRRIVIGSIDPNEKVNGQGIAKLCQAGIEVVTQVLDKECRKLNRRFFTYYQKKRPYIILKWAQTADGFMDVERDEHGFAPPYWITNQELRTLSHKWRSEEDAIAVGFNTWQHDHPQLNTRFFPGKNPQAFVIMRNRKNVCGIPFEQLPESGEEACKVLYDKKIQSIIIEGGRRTLDYFIQHDLWDEARILTGDQVWGKGTLAPEFHHALDEERMIMNHSVAYVRRYL